MITLDTLRATLLAADPYDGIDRLIRSELAAGRNAKAIYEEVLPLVKPLRATGELTEDADEALLGALDGLTGNCHPDSAYRDTPESGKLPTEEEVAELPHWAQVAFGARSISSVLPLLNDITPPIAALQRDRLALAVKKLERAATLRDHSIALDVWSDMARASKEYREANQPIGEAIAFAASDTAMLAISAETQTPPNGIIYKSMKESPQQLVARAASEMGVDIVPQIRRDYDTLRQHAETEHWTDDTPVPPSIFGPLWPEGPPPKWPSIKHEGTGNRNGSSAGYVIRTRATVQPGGKVEVTDPKLPVGRPVEVVVTVSEPAPVQTRPPGMGIYDWIKSLPPGPRSAESWEEIERQFQEERDSWDR